MARRLRWVALCAAMLSTPLLGGDWRAALPSAQPLGSGDFTWWGLRLYSARLWTDGQDQDWARPFALELLYHRALTRDSLVQASLQEMQRIGGDAVTAQQVADWGQIMQTAFTDVRPGMRIAGLYLPGSGCRFYVDGKLTAQVRDAAFAKAFFAIWLDPQARDPQLRLRLLGQAADRGT